MKGYPDDWIEIRKRILARAGNKCEWCGVANHAIGVRGYDGTFYSDDAACAAIAIGLADIDAPIVRIVLTIAHVDNPDPMDCREENLAALCQRCHNRHDMPMRLQNRKRTQREKILARLREQGQLEMELG